MIATLERRRPCEPAPARSSFRVSRERTEARRDERDPLADRDFARDRQLRAITRPSPNSEAPTTTPRRRRLSSRRGEIQRRMERREAPWCMLPEYVSRGLGGIDAVGVECEPANEVRSGDVEYCEWSASSSWYTGWRGRSKQQITGDSTATTQRREDNFVIPNPSRVFLRLRYSFMPLLLSGSRNMLPIRAAMASSCWRLGIIDPGNGSGISNPSPSRRGIRWMW